ncbi:hypothetical protein [Longimicrobium sp.]|uniref:hypothetical protein n=1 Tax=Longimicrobium sp. TaxID=2029185 RepID=UPI002CC9F222|nr:hypothetical protein [Longimicrobium sp.]HSU13523.1 hypothetical protein [Longimicrobium sp.]
MKKLLLLVCSAVTFGGSYVLLSPPASAQTPISPCTPPKGAENCKMTSCSCSNGWCTSTWVCP